MRQTKHFFILLMILCIGLIGWGVSSAQSQLIDLPELFTSQNSIAFRYPTGWTVVEEADSVSVSDGKITIEFYSQDITESILILGNNSPQEGIKTFFSVLGVDYQGATTVELQGETVVGGFQLTSGQGEYALLGIGKLMSPPGWVFIHITGRAIDLLGSTDTFMAIIGTFGTLQTATDTNGNSPTPIGNTGVVAQPAPAEPCFIRTSQINFTEVRVGPGSNRSVVRYLEANRDFTVVGTADAANGSKWWRIDKNEAAPTQAVNETWVADSQVTTTGGCETVGIVSAPPIIRPRPTAASGTGGSSNGSAQPTPVPGSNDIFIDFFANQSRISTGSCTDINWDVRNAREVYYHGFLAFSHTSFQTECPTVTTDFQLRVVPNSGADIFRTVTVVVDNNFVQCGTDAIPFFETGSIPVGGQAYHYIYLDPCASSRRIFIEMYATGNDGLDPYLDVFIDNVYYGSDDDSGGNQHAYIEVNIPAGASLISMTAKGYNSASGGTYEILAEYIP